LTKAHFGCQGLTQAHLHVLTAQSTACKTHHDGIKGKETKNIDWQSRSWDAGKKSTRQQQQARRKATAAKSGQRQKMRSARPDHKPQQSFLTWQNFEGL
jgi:hypothetical protein